MTCCRCCCCGGGALDVADLDLDLDDIEEEERSGVMPTVLKWTSLLPAELALMLAVAVTSLFAALAVGVPSAVEGVVDLWRSVTSSAMPVPLRLLLLLFMSSSLRVLVLLCSRVTMRRRGDG